MRISDWSSDVCSSDLEVDQRRLLAAQRRALLRQGHLRHVRRLRRLVATDLQADDEGALQQQLRERFLGRFVDDLRRRRQHVLSAGQPGRVLARGLARLHRAELRPELLRPRSEEHTSELQSLMRISYAVFCLKKKKQTTQ